MGILQHQVSCRSGNMLPHAFECPLLARVRVLLRFSLILLLLGQPLSLSLPGHKRLKPQHPPSSAKTTIVVALSPSHSMMASPISRSTSLPSMALNTLLPLGLSSKALSLAPLTRVQVDPASTIRSKSRVFDRSLGL